MKRTFFNALFLLLCISVQAETITSDSLLQRIKQGEVIYDIIDNIFIGDIDFKDVYFNEELKPYMLQLLDEKSYRQHEIETLLESSFGSDDAKMRRIKEWLRDNSCSLSFDTIMSTPDLYQAYLDSAYSDFSSNLYSHYNVVIPNVYEEVLCRIHWPVVYKEYHRQWVEDGKNITSKRFYAMLCMHDPDATDIFDKYVDDLLQNKSDSLNKEWYIHRPSAAMGSYEEKLRLRGLKYTNLITFTPFPQDREESLTVPYNIKIASELIGYDCPSERAQQIMNKISVSVSFLGQTFLKLNEDLTIDEYISIGMEIKENAQLFMDIYQPFIQKKEQEELYWKQNMPYYKP
ncbi:MAG: hypothetical protein J6W13_11615 [Salinivirgaceae bacterium]|nr:hypothetical protein [Salinivirgaceae bacterium]